jgi:excisionase family DNA binding protein
VAPTGNPYLHDIPAVQQLLGLGRCTIFDLIKTGRLRSVKVGARRLVSEAAIADFVTSLEEAGA